MSTEHIYRYFTSASNPEDVDYVTFTGGAFDLVDDIFEFETVEVTPSLADFATKPESTLSNIETVAD